MAINDAFSHYCMNLIGGIKDGTLNREQSVLVNSPEEFSSCILEKGNMSITIAGTNILYLYKQTQIK